MLMQEVPIHNSSMKYVSESFVNTTKSTWTVSVHLTKMFIKPVWHLDVELIYLDISFETYRRGHKYTCLQPLTKLWLHSPLLHDQAGKDNQFPQVSRHGNSRDPQCSWLWIGGDPCGMPTLTCSCLAVKLDMTLVRNIGTGWDRATSCLYCLGRVCIYWAGDPLNSSQKNIGPWNSWLCCSILRYYSLYR